VATSAGTCDHCDLSEISKLSSKLLQVLAEATAAQGNKISEIKVNQLKTKLLETACITPNSEQILMPMLYKRLELFASNNTSKWSMSAATSSMASAFSSQVTSGQDLLDAHISDLATNYFLSDERNEIAGYLIRKHDRNCEYHCNITRCGNHCIFTPMHCQNDGCPDIFSAKWLSDHDSKCPYKIVNCIRECGDCFQRKMMDAHLESSCPLRPAYCPFKDLGCGTGTSSHSLHYTQ